MNLHDLHACLCATARAHGLTTVKLAAYQPTVPLTIHCCFSPLKEREPLTTLPFVEELIPAGQTTSELRESNTVANGDHLLMVLVLYTQQARQQTLPDTCTTASF